MEHLKIVLLSDFSCFVSSTITFYYSIAIDNENLSLLDTKFTMILIFMQINKRGSRAATPLSNVAALRHAQKEGRSRMAQNRAFCRPWILIRKRQ